jgi:hypothetical protein
MKQTDSKTQLTLETHNARLREVCPVAINKWRIGKALLYSTFLASVTAGMTTFNAPPDIVWPITLIGIIVFLVGEVREIEVANTITVLFNGKHHPNQDDDD